MIYERPIYTVTTVLIWKYIYIYIYHDSICYDRIHIILIIKSIRPFTSHLNMLPFRQHDQEQACLMDVRIGSWQLNGSWHGPKQV